LSAAISRPVTWPQKRCGGTGTATTNSAGVDDLGGPLNWKIAKDVPLLGDMLYGLLRPGRKPERFGLDD
jgi:hypothetical protein